MTKKRTKQTKKRSNNRWHKNVLFAVVILSIVTLVGFVSGWLGYEIGATNVEPAPKEQVEKKLQTAQEELDALRARLAKLENGSKVSVKKQDVIINLLTETGDYGKIEEPPPPPKKIDVDRPFIAIIIDDVAYEHQLKKIESMNIAVTPSIFPPAKDFGTTPKLARESKKYMVHLPMEAKSHPKYALPQTLTREWTQTQIDSYITQVRRWFPGAIYINNHTGSAYTEDEDAVKRLYRSLDKHNFTFIDSRTTPKTTVEKVMHQNSKEYLRRDVFLDNELDSAYINGQIKEVVAIAKKYGSAMAIGHPHAITLQALQDANGLFDGIDVVYVDEYIARLNGK